MDVVILCGGLGTRLRSVSAGRQKTMVKIGDKPFLEIVMDWAAGHGLRRFVLCAGYQGHQVRDYFQRHARGLDISFSQEEEPLGTAGALKRCSGLLKGGPILLLNGDSYCPVDLKSMFEFHQLRNAVVTVAAVPAGSRVDGGFMDINHDQRIVSFNEKEPRPDRALNAGVYILERNILDAIPSGKAVSLEKEIMPVLLPQGSYAYRCPGPLYDIGTPDRLEAFCRQHARQFNEVTAS